jgi:hypothetical protein
VEALEKQAIDINVTEFYYLSRAALVKDERHLDKFDRVFGHVFKGLELVGDGPEVEIPAEWLKKLVDKYLTEEEKKQIEAMGGLDKLLETLKKRMAEQKGRHQGGSKWIGTGGTSPFGAYGDHPEGVRIGQDKGRRGSGEGLGQTRVQGFRRRRDAGAAQHPHRAATAQAFCARGRRGRARPRRHDSLHRRQGLHRRQAQARATQRRQGAPVPRRRRLDGLARGSG